eukprot:520180_1
MLSSFIFASMILLIYQTLGDLSCNNASHCNGHYLFHYHIYAKGYYSVSGPNTSVLSHQVSCEGTRSCNDILNMSAMYLDCFGDDSCSHLGDVEYITISRQISCRGASSCSFSTLTIDYDAPSPWTNAVNNMFVSCRGFKSCANSHFYKIAGIFAKGAYSLMNSIITNSTMISLRGYYAGSNSTVVSDINHPCTVKCAYVGCVFRNITCSGTCAIDFNLLLFQAPNVIDYDYECSKPSSFAIDNYPP